MTNFDIGVFVFLGISFILSCVALFIIYKKAKSKEKKEREEEQKKINNIRPFKY